MRTITLAATMSILWTSVVSAADYLPLKEGNQWVYKMSNGMEITTKVAGFENIGAVRCAMLDSTVSGQTTREYVAVDAEGVKSYMSQMQGQQFRYDPPVLRIKLPYRQGDAWQATVNQMGMSMNTNFESAGQERVQTPAGLFDCIKVRSSMDMGTGQSMAATIWYCDGIGQVQQVMQMNGQEFTITLVSTNVQPPIVSPVPQPQVTPTAPIPQVTPTVPGPQVGPTAPSAADQRCPKCGAKVQAGAKFCWECGTRIEPPKPAAPTHCPKCGVKLPAGAKFCPACGEKIVGSATVIPPVQAGDMPRANGPATVIQPATVGGPVTAGEPTMEKYQSADGKLVLYKPADWQVTEGNMFGQDIYAVIVMEPKESAVALFMTFPMNPEIKDSVALAAKCIAALREEFPDLQTTNMSSTPDRARTMAELTLTDDGEQGTGHGYFFHTQSIGTFYLLLAKTPVWNQYRPTLTAIMANLAFAPQGVATIQEQGQRLAGQTPVVDGATLSPAALLQQAARRAGKQLTLRPAALPDQSLSIQIPQGWNLEGQGTQFIVTNNPQTRTHGMGGVWHTIIPTGMQIPGAINAPYQAPPQALSLVLELGQTSRNVQVISQCGAEQVVQETAQAVQQLRAQGFQVDARLLHVRFLNVPTGTTLRGLFSVTCSTQSMSPVWQVFVQGSWAPENEFDEWIPLYMRIEKTLQINQQWMGQEMQNRAVRQQQLNRNLQRSIAEANQAFDGYMDSLQNASRSRDYTAHMWSQTTLGQGTWVAENEGARVYQTDDWGIQGPEGRIDSSAYNTTHFTGENPWGGADLELVDTREEYERYIANR
ncbi:MAG: zinc ribbon domain-containing protein [Phycisphaerae bacterium]|nr:zinc ribbon domain-containing protein [Phycisphaerae bacterium]